MRAYEECLSKPSTRHAPWYVVPADQKKDARLIVSQVIVDTHNPGAGLGYRGDLVQAGGSVAASGRRILDALGREGEPPRLEEVEARLRAAGVEDFMVNAGGDIASAGHDANGEEGSVGIRNPSEVQITRGLSPGEIVITSGGYALSDGLTVRAMVSQQ